MRKLTFAKEELHLALEADDMMYLVCLVRQRFEKRFFRIVLGDVHGFTKMALGCLTIESLTSFYNGTNITIKVDRDYAPTIEAWLGHEVNEPLSKLRGVGFYGKIRNGILHQAETKDDWRIKKHWISSQLDCNSIYEHDLICESEKIIYADEFACRLYKCFLAWVSRLKKRDSELYSAMKRKLSFIADNSQAGTILA